MPERWKGWSRLLSKLRSNKRILLLLDFDGPLAPIVPLPQQAQLPWQTREALIKLQKNPRITVAFISGRALTDLKHKAFLYGAWYAGNHGLEIRGPQTSFQYPGIRGYVKIIRQLAAHLKKTFKPVPGSLIQDKELSLSVHFRNVKKCDMSAFDKLIKRSLIETSRLPVVWRKGRKVYEVIPAVDWDKGRAALWLMKKLRNPLPLAFGDDKTDDSMFRMLKYKGITTRIGKKRKLAHYSIRNPERVFLFLHLLEKRLHT